MAWLFPPPGTPSSLGIIAKAQNHTALSAAFTRLHLLLGFDATGWAIRCLDKKTTTEIAIDARGGLEMHPRMDGVVLDTPCRKDPAIGKRPEQAGLPHGPVCRRSDPGSASLWFSPAEAARMED